MNAYNIITAILKVAGSCTTTSSTLQIILSYTDIFSSVSPTGFPYGEPARNVRVIYRPDFNFTMLRFVLPAPCNSRFRNRLTFYNGRSVSWLSGN